MGLVAATVLLFTGLSANLVIGLNGVEKQKMVLTTETVGFTI